MDNDCIDWAKVSDSEIEEKVTTGRAEIKDYQAFIRAIRDSIQPYCDEQRRRRKMATAARKAAEEAKRVQCKEVYRIPSSGIWPERVVRCNVKTTSASGYCVRHDPDVPRCLARHCNNLIGKARAGAHFCRKHDPELCASSYCDATRRLDSKFCENHQLPQYAIAEHGTEDAPIDKTIEPINFNEND